MHILFLSHYFPPEVNAPATRTYEHCKHWVEMGHSVTVILGVAQKPHHVPQDNPTTQKRPFDEV